MAHDQSIIRQLRKEDMASVSIKTTGLYWFTSQSTLAS